MPSGQTLPSGTAPSPSSKEVLACLRDQFGHSIVLTPDSAHWPSTIQRDWSDATAVEPIAILEPQCTKDVCEILRFCSTKAIPLAIQGGMTGLVGGANTQEGEVVLSLGRLNQIEHIDPVAGTALVQAGVTLEQLQIAAQELDWFFPLDLGARGSCQIGGNAATNAGGNRVIRYGMMRNAVLGLEVVLADGRCMDRLDSVIKNNAGFDLKQLFIGSEGLLGVITKLVIQLEPRPRAQCTALCALSDFSQATQLLKLFKRVLPELSAFEVMWHAYLHESARHQKLDAPFLQEYPLYVLVETLGHDNASSTQALEEALQRALEDETIVDAVLAQSAEQSQKLWAYREGVSGLLSALKPFAAFDVSVALPQMDLLVQELRGALSSRFKSQSHLFFGHLGDGNLHLLSGPYASKEELLAVEGLVYQRVSALGGSISAEHGIGVVKKDFLHYSKSPEEIELMRQLKQLLDPQNILNRGRVLSV